jgi:stearoyl-CoA desaturase (delta-9 desaturase)
MAFIDRVLRAPEYGWVDATGMMVRPTPGQILWETLTRFDLRRTRKNWICIIAWFWVLCLLPAPVLFATYHFSGGLLALGVLFGIGGMSTHGTIWYHRYCTHRAFTFSHPAWRFVTQNLVPKVVPEEIYVVSHKVHHVKSDQPGDPYNASAGFLYCFLADVNHQPIAHDLSEEDYARVVKMLSHTGIYLNSYRQYQLWGSVSHPAPLFLHVVLSWVIWYAVYYAIGGHALALALFSGVLLWALGVRTFNYQGHGRGRDLRRDGVDFNRRDMSVNQWRPGVFGSEWHNNHHLFPGSARSGFLWYQWDCAWLYVRLLHYLGAVASYRDDRQRFLDEYYLPERLAGTASEAFPAFAPPETAETISETPSSTKGTLSH